MPPLVRMDLKKRKSPQDKDTVTIRGEHTAVFQAWNQASLPHEAVHFMVEDIFGLVGFVRLTAAGISSERMIEEQDPAALACENLTNAYQYELFGMSQTGNAGLRQLLHDFVAAGSGALAEYPDELLEAGRARLLELAGAWAALPLGGHLELELPEL
ncbi:MAG: hypothetical protein O2816_19455 [Planctomycetota bacterium]|nr:hypothetical protein [Planctomycetota bacterium]